MGCEEIRGARKMRKNYSSNKSKINPYEISEIKKEKSVNYKTENSNVEYEIKLTKTSKTFFTNTIKESLLLEMEDNIPFPPGEHHYKLIKDSNKSKLIEKNDSLSERVQLFFSLNKVYYPNNKYSFGISLINNKKIGISTFLGRLNDGSGETIEFGECFEIDYFFEREQIITIEPIINGKSTEQKKTIYFMYFNDK